MSIKCTFELILKRNHTQYKSNYGILLNGTYAFSEMFSYNTIYIKKIPTDHSL